ncbi:hypothetical protein B0H10DRAFT_1778305, partial [Mycena sp. CBHHK59/15]
HRCGNFFSLTMGQSHGSRQVEPGTVIDGVINTTVLCALLTNIIFIRLAGFATSIFANWAPNLFDYYVQHMRPFYTCNPHLNQPFLYGIWSTCTFNLSPMTCTLGHWDFVNLAFGWCTITALGAFDYRKGGHLILWDCKLVIESSSSTTILIPSAAIFHSNISVSEVDAG